MAHKLSQRVQRVKPSPTLAVSALATALKAQGKDVIGLGVGEPDFHTPEHIKQAGIQAIKEGKTGYTAVDGTAELKQAIIDKFKRDNDFDYKAEQILVSSGGKQSFYNLCQAVLDQGDEVIIPAPYWVSYPDMVLLADATPVIVEAGQNQGFKLNAQQLENAITDKTRLFVINSPSNPTGVAYTKQDLKELADVLLKYPNVLIATDDMYEHILWPEIDFVNILNVCPELNNRCLVLNGVSKAYAMTGWRIGYCGGPADIIKAMKKVQSQSTSNPCSVSQAAAVAALNGSQECIQTMLSAFKTRHDEVVDLLNDINGFECLPADGTFYAFPNVQKVINKIDGINNDVDLSSLILDKVGVALVPGSAFGLEGHLRLSFAADIDTLRDAISRIKRCVE